jgi:integrase
MNTVEPIRDIGTVNDIADYLREHSERNYIMFMIGIYSGLRISDILTLRVRDVRNRDRIMIREKKTGKERRFPINKALKKDLDKYIEPMHDYEFLIKSRKDRNKPITRQQAWTILQEAGERFGVQKIGTHTMRKTFGYHMYQQTHDIVAIQKILNHATQEYTLRYIGVTQDTLDTAINNLDFGR